MKRIVSSKSRMPASEPRPCATNAAAALPSFMHSDGGQPSRNARMKPAQYASPHPDVSTTAISCAAQMHPLARSRQQAAVASHREHNSAHAEVEQSRGCLFGRA